MLLGLVLGCTAAPPKEPREPRKEPDPVLQMEALPLPAAGQVLDKEKLVVLDGDTLRYGRETIRLLGVDAPEASSPHFKGDQGWPAQRARRALEEWLETASEVRLLAFDKADPFGRTLGYLLLDGENLSARLVEKGFALENVSHFGDQGFPELAAEVLEAARTAPEPDFEPPHLWRNRNRINGS